ncbi:MAG TPA: hypothetical protein DG084_01520, partial [Gemmatimonadetes bacterium]|nr:hypothetical protein [Gemmatimonadota bacterium]
MTAFEAFGLQYGIARVREDGRDTACPANCVALVGGEDDVAYAYPELEGETKMGPTGDEQGI